jgi:23S rRNA-/tRNA-specific pseudouridylate synthase
VNGDIQEPTETSITSKEAESLGVCVGNDEPNRNETEMPWQIIDKELDDQSAVTIWRVVRKMRLENARNDTVSLVELKPKTGRYHQLRRHMVSGETMLSPIVHCCQVLNLSSVIALAKS